MKYLKEATCKTCNKREMLNYRAIWYRRKQGTNQCRSCANKAHINNTGRFKKGMKPWNNGNHNNNMIRECSKCGKNKSATYSPHCRSCSKKGSTWKVSPEKLVNLGRKGNKHHNWKGGITPFDTSERKRFKREIQELVFKRDGYKCVLCRSAGDLQVDHIQSWAEYVELRFNIDNCRTLCSKCHYLITFKRPMPEHVKAWGHNIGRRKIL